MSEALPVVRLKPGREKSLLRRHPWVFSGAVDGVEGDPAPGAAVEVRSARGDFLARGFWSPGSQIRVRAVVFDETETPHTGPVCTSHSYKPPATRRIDYIFVSDGFRVLSHRTHADRPGGKYPSDHDAVSARLDFK